MTSETRSVLELCDQLSPARRAEVMDFVRFLLQQERGASDTAGGDEAWEKLIGDVQPLPKLDAFTKAALAEGSEPMDHNNL